MRAKGCRSGKSLIEEGEQLGNLIGKIVEHLGVAVALEGESFHGTAAGSAADAEIDSAGIEGVEGAEDLRHLERGVVRQHDAAGADADSPGLRADASEHDLRRGAGQRVHGVVFGHPEAAITEGVNVAGKLD